MMIKIKWKYSLGRIDTNSWSDGVKDKWILSSIATDNLIRDNFSFNYENQKT
jgi:hypothetical protein